MYKGDSEPQNGLIVKWKLCSLKYHRDTLELHVAIYLTLQIVNK